MERAPKLQHTFLECLFIKLRGSLENWDPPPLLRFTKKALFGPSIYSLAFGSIKRNGAPEHTAYLPDQVLRDV